MAAPVYHSSPRTPIDGACDGAGACYARGVTHDELFLITAVVAAMVGLVVAVIHDRSVGAQRRDARQRRARKHERLDRATQRELEKALPRATVVSDDRDEP